MNRTPLSKCDRLALIKPDEEWWFYQCAGGVPENTTGIYSEEKTRDLLSHLEPVFDNKWYVKHGNIANKGICGVLLLGGVQNTVGNIMRLASNISSLGGIGKLGSKTRSDLRNVRKCRDTVLELEVLGCFAQEGFMVSPYPQLATGQNPDAKVRVGGTDVFVEVTNIEWPPADDFPGFSWKSKQGTKIIEKCLRKAAQLPVSECSVIVVNPATLIDEEIGQIILESARGFLLPDVYNRISGIIISNKLIERSGFIKAQPIVLINDYASRRCDEEIERLAEALWKYPEIPMNP